MQDGKAHRFSESNRPRSRCAWILAAALLGNASQAQEPRATIPGPEQERLAQEYDRTIRPLIHTYCYECHATDVGEGDVDLEQYTGLAALRAGTKAWMKVADVLGSGEMPPRDAKPLPAADRDRIRDWVRRFLHQEAVAQAGDPGPVMLRRLNNAQYTHTVRDLTGVPLDPAREFPNDSAAGEGFTNAGNALVMSPALFTKYFDAAKKIAEHAVLLPHGMVFSPGTSPRDWSDEWVAKIRNLYARYTDSSEGTQVNLQGIVFATNEGGRLPLARYFEALLKDRDALRQEIKTLDHVAAESELSRKFLGILWRVLEEDATPSLLLDGLRQSWRQTQPGGGAALAESIVPWQRALWRFSSVGHVGKVGGPKAWMEPVSPLAERTEVRLKFGDNEIAGKDEVVLYLGVGDAGDGATGDVAVWQNPRLVTPGRPDIPLKDLRRVAEEAQSRRERILAQTAGCLHAAAAVARAPANERADRNLLARNHAVDRDALDAWFGYLGVGEGAAEVPADAVLRGRLENGGGYPFIQGWGFPDTPSVMANSSDQHVRIPGNMRPHSVAIHPSPQQRVAAGWRSPVRGLARVTGIVQHAHPECGNGVTWQVEIRRGNTRERLAVGVAAGPNPVGFGPVEGLVVRPGDLIELSIGPRDGNHACDLTGVDLKIEVEDQIWDLAGDVSPDILAGNPHGDQRGNKDVWFFFTEAEQGTASDLLVPQGSLLARWQSEEDETARMRLAREIQALVSQPQPPAGDGPDARLYRQLRGLRGPLLGRMNAADAAAPAKQNRVQALPLYGLQEERFGRLPDGTAIGATDLAMHAPGMIEVRLPAELAAGSEFVATGILAQPSGREGSVQMFAGLTQPAPGGSAHAETPIVATVGSTRWNELAAEIDAFRQLFPPAVCYSRIVPVDEVITLALFFREDDHLKRLLLDDRETAELDRLWDELRFVSRDALLMVDAFAQLLEYASQDGDPRIFEPLRGPIEARAAAFRQALLESEPRHLEAVIDFASRAFRRPLNQNQAEDLRRLYLKLRAEELPHEDAIRLVLARVFVAPEFLYLIESPPETEKQGPVTSWELASRLSYFLWSSMPDQELWNHAAAGDLVDAEVLSAQARRMLKDERIRRLAEEFACQWLHVYDFPALDEKSERHFPGFTALRGAMYEETIRFFQDLFQNDGSVLSILNADYTYLNEDLAKHYGIAGVQGSQWRRVSGIRDQGRGGILGFSTTLAKQSGASRTSPILRGNWISEVLLGEKLPRPPKNVPQLPEDEAATELTMRQVVEKHTSDARCSGCHARIDPFGFALEGYDAIGRTRTKDLGDRPIDTRTRLPDGTEIDGMAGLRQYLVETRRDAFVRQFCRKLLGYALGRGVQLSDQPLLDSMESALASQDYRIGAAVDVLVRSRPFREIRGKGVREDTAH
jgi:hypothetical protein